MQYFSLTKKFIFLRLNNRLIQKTMVKITFPDGSVREYNEGVTGLQIAESISSRFGTGCIGLWGER